jgi:hypothetical protein
MFLPRQITKPIFKFSFSKVPLANYFYKKKILPNHLEIRKKEKIVEDLIKMHEISDFKNLAAVNQSDFFHNSLFEMMSKRNNFKIYLLI